MRPHRVDYTQMKEASDETDLKSEPACAGGACDLR
jgi:ribonucleoside-triphosphate reductase (thioredoxin)